MATLEPLTGERQSNESDKAVQACNDYLRLGPGRSLAKLHQRYTEGSPGVEPPTRSLRWMKEWSRRYSWVDRAEQFDAEWEQRKSAERRAELDHGLSLDYQRVRELKRLARFLTEQIYEQGVDGAYHNVWVPDVKVVGSGDYAEVVDIERFNQGILRELRATLDDLASEVGDRIKRQDIHVTTWQDTVVEKLRTGELTPDEVRAAWPDLAAEFFAKAGVRVDEK